MKIAISPVKRAAQSRETGNEWRNAAGTMRRRGGQPGNQNALRHGRWSAAAITARKLSIAQMKALCHAVVALDLLREKHRHRVKPLRVDQAELLRRFDPELLKLVSLQRLPSEQDGAFRYNNPENENLFAGATKGC